MSLTPSNISILLLILTALILLSVTQCQRNKITEQESAIEAECDRAQALQEQLELMQSTLEADRKRIIEVAKRFDQVLTNYTTGVTAAHENHENRINELMHIQSTDAVDWLCDPVPDDIRRMLNCSDKASGGGGADADSAAGGSHTTMYQAGVR